MVPEAYASGTFVTPYYIYKRTLLFFMKNGCCLKHFSYLCNTKRIDNGTERDRWHIAQVLSIFKT